MGTRARQTKKPDSTTSPAWKGELASADGFCLEHVDGAYFLTVHTPALEEHASITPLRSDGTVAQPVSLRMDWGAITVIFGETPAIDDRGLVTALLRALRTNTPLYCRTPELHRELCELLERVTFFADGERRSAAALADRVKHGPPNWDAPKHPHFPWPVPTQPEKQSRRRPALPALTDGGHIIVLSPGHYQALREALYKNTFQQTDGSPWPTASLERGTARGQAQLVPAIADTHPLMSPDEVETWARIMWQQQSELSDLDADALDGLSAVWLSQARTPQDDAVIAVDDLLAMRGLQAKRGGQGRRGGYRPEQRKAILQAVSHIQNIWLTIAEVDVYTEGPDGRRQRKLQSQTFQSRAFVITDRVGQLRLDGYMDVERFIFRPGKAFGAFLFGPGRQTALLSAKALEYDPYRQTWEKRLARYLSWQWRAQARHGEHLRPYRTSTLLDAVGEAPDLQRPARTRDRLEKALDVLQEDGVIAAWQYERWDEDITDQRGWINEWLQATILIEPPEDIKDQYLHLNRKDQSQPSPIALLPDFGQRIRLRRKQLGLTQLQAAEQLSISQGHMSRLERGKLAEHRLSPDTRQRIHIWLGETPFQE